MAFLSTMPNLTIYSPATQQELVHMLELAISRGEPAAVRYPRGSLMQAVSPQPVEKGVWEEMQPISERTVIATGAMIPLPFPFAENSARGLSTRARSSRWTRRCWRESNARQSRLW